MAALIGSPSGRAWLSWETKLFFCCANFAIKIFFAFSGSVVSSPLDEVIEISVVSYLGFLSDFCQNFLQVFQL